MADEPLRRLLNRPVSMRTMLDSNHADSFRTFEQGQRIVHRPCRFANVFPGDQNSSPPGARLIPAREHEARPARAEQCAVQQGVIRPCRIFFNRLADDDEIASLSQRAREVGNIRHSCFRRAYLKPPGEVGHPRAYINRRAIGVITRSALKLVMKFDGEIEAARCRKWRQADGNADFERRADPRGQIGRHLGAS